MKSLVTYFTQTNNTKMIAEAIFEVISPHGEAQIDTVRKVDLESLNEYDVVFVGAPCHDSDLAPPVKGFLGKLPKSPKFKLVGFFTHSTNMPDGTERNQELYDQWAGRCIPTFENACKDKNIELLGYFHCQGKASEPIEGFIRQQIITDDDEWAIYLPELRKHPNSNDIENAKKFAQEILDKL
ncbi:MAG: flavodoxin domain-containing protein [Candidatus Thorarchaeota archaeon]|nr:flavodoxin domain-containing protein [Candidatus Thorarchaeota archaeon]